MLIEVEEIYEKLVDKYAKQFGYKKPIKICEDKHYIEVEELMNIIEDYQYEVEHLEDKLIQMTQDIEDNYKPISKGEQYEYGE